MRGLTLLSALLVSLGLGQCQLIRTHIIAFSAPPPPNFLPFHPPLYAPEITLQASAGAGFRAYLPDDCGVENFVFECKKTPGKNKPKDTESGEDLTPETTEPTAETTPESTAQSTAETTAKPAPETTEEPSEPPPSFEEDAEWLFGNVTAPKEDYWQFEAPNLALKPGDVLLYRAVVIFQGAPFFQPPTVWTVPELVSEWKMPSRKGKPCPPKEEPEEEPTTTSRPEKEETTPTSTTEVAVASTKHPDLLPREDDKKPKEADSPLPGPPCHAPWLLEPLPTDSRSVLLEKQVARLQCEMENLRRNFSLLTNTLHKELTDLKKLNYAMVTRMARLDNFLRSLPAPPTWPTPGPLYGGPL